MEIRLQKWGNSIGIRIPNAFLKSLKLKNNDKILLVQEEDKIIITKSNNNNIDLKERFDNYKGENLALEFEWDSPVGKEIW